MTLYRWVPRFTPLLIDAARPARHLASDRWFVDETYVKVSGVRCYDFSVGLRAVGPGPLRGDAEFDAGSAP